MNSLKNYLTGRATARYDYYIAFFIFLAFVGFGDIGFT